MIKAKLGHELDRLLRPILPIIDRWSPHPNLMTVIGTTISMVAAAAFALGEFRVGALLLAAGGLFDLLDGAVARRRGISSSFGAFLDSTLDRLVDMAIFIGLMLFYGQANRPGLVLLAGAGLVVSVMTSYAKARVEDFIPSMSGGVLERAERIVLVIIGGLTGAMVLALWIIATLGTVTVAQRFRIAYRALKSHDAAAGSGLEGSS